jgi:hypothetical protein
MEVVAHQAPRGGDKFLSVNQTHIHFDPNRKSVNFHEMRMIIWCQNSKIHNSNTKRGENL